MDADSLQTQMVAAAESGDRDALAQLLVEHSGPLMRRLAVRLELNPFADFDVEDVLQEVFLDVFRGIGTFRPDNGTPFKVWIGKVADNRLAAMLRQRSRVKRGGERQPIRTVASSPLRKSVRELVHYLADHRGDTGSQNAAREETVQAVRQGLLALTDDQRAVMEVYYLDGGSLDGTAADLAKTQGAVRGLLHRAKKSLREALGRSSRWFYRK